MSTKKYLYGLTVQGIQSYIFETNKLREIVGASEIVEQITRKFLQEILADSFNENNLLLSAAGNIKYLFDDEKEVQTVIDEFPKKISKVSKSIKFSQAVIPVDGDLTDTHYRELEKKLNAQRNKPDNSPDMLTMGRNLNRVTGKAEYKFIIHNNKRESLDFETSKKRDNDDSKLLINKVDPNSEFIFPKEIEKITNSQSKNFVAVIHADGNKLGSTIQKIVGQTFDKKEAFLKALSDRIEQSTIAAFKDAFYSVIDNSNKKVPLRPIILGGDDLTLIIRADLALPFTKIYLETFEKQTKKNFSELLAEHNITDNDIIQSLQNGLTATAGIVFIKEKYPFHYAVHLSESITSKAKNLTNREKSSVLFYKVKDSFVNSYDDIIDNELKPNEFNFLTGPYNISEIDNLLNKVKFMKKDDFPKGALRELLTTMYQNTDKANFKWSRIWEINKNNKTFKKMNFDKSLKDNNIIYDLITIDSLTVEK